MGENTIKANKKHDTYVDRNCICTMSPTCYGEIVMYKRPFKIPLEVTEREAHLRKFFRDEEVGCWIPRCPVDLIKQDLMLRKCGKRATKKIILYAMANIWEQFITLTFDPKMVNRYDEIECKEKWREFERYCKRTFPDCKMLAVWEYHRKRDEFGARALHFHILASGLRFPTIPYLDKDGSQIYSKSGAPLYILTPRAWPFGLSTVAYLPKDGSDNARVVNYLTKYVSKYRARSGDSVKMCREVSNYSAQRYYHTRNLEICVQTVLDDVLTEKEVREFARVNGFELHKENDRMIVFRRFPEGSKHEPIIGEMKEKPEKDPINIELLTDEGIEIMPVPKYRLKLVTDESIISLF